MYSHQGHKIDCLRDVLSILFATWLHYLHAFIQCNHALEVLFTCFRKDEHAVALGAISTHPEHIPETDGAPSVGGPYSAVEDEVTQLHHVGDHLNLSLPAALRRLTALQRPAKRRNSTVLLLSCGLRREEPDQELRRLTALQWPAKKGT